MPKGCFKHKPLTEETRKKIGLANKGRVFSDEWRKNLSIAHRGQVSWRKGKTFVDKKEQYKKKLAYRRSCRHKNKERIIEQERKWRKLNRSVVNNYARLRYKENRQKELDRVRFKKYGITGEEFRIILAKQNNKCPICHRDIKKNLSVDHNHSTKKIRGLICNNCNLSIGNANDSPKILRAMAKYLEGIDGT